MSGQESQPAYKLHHPSTKQKAIETNQLMTLLIYKNIEWMAFLIYRNGVDGISHL